MDWGHVARFLAVLVMIVAWPGGALVVGLIYGGRLAMLWLLLPVLVLQVLLLVLVGLFELWDVTA